MASLKSEILHLTVDNGEKSVNSVQTSVKRQLFATITMDLLMFSYGATCGWPSASIPLLKSDDTSLESGPISTDDASWIASGICIGGFIGNLLIGWLATKVGQKIALYFVALSQVVGWLMIYYATNPYYLIASRILNGVSGGGIFAIIPTYISEISDNDVRGTFGSTLVFSGNLGVFFAFVLGEYVDYLVLPWLLVPASLLFLVFFIRVPDSATFLAKKNLYEKAENSLLYFKNIGKYSTYTKQQVNEELQKLHFNASDDGENKLSIGDFQPRHARKALIYGICLMALNQFCGCFAMMTFTATIFKESGSNLSPNMSSIIVGVIQIIGSMFPTILVDRLGRKLMMGLSAYGTTIGLFGLGSYILLKSEGFSVENFSWIPLVAFSLIIFLANWGLMTLPFMIVSEISHPKIRGFVTALCMSFLWVFAFIGLKYTPTLIDCIGMHGTMFLFAFNSLVGALFITIFLPETMGKSFEEIVDLLEK